MREYQFKYTDLKNLTWTFIIAILLLFLSIYFTIPYIEEINQILMFLIIFLPPLIIFSINWKNLTVKASGRIYNSKVELNLKDNEYQIDFSNLNSFKIKRNDAGVRLILWLKPDNKRIYIFSNSNFTDEINFDNFCDDLASQINNYNQKIEETVSNQLKEDENYSLKRKEKIERKKSFLEKKYSFYVLVLVTISAIAIISYVIIKDYRFSGLLVFSLLSLMGLWSAWLIQQNRN